MDTQSKSELARVTDRTLRLLWRDHLDASRGSRGPRQRVSVDDVVSGAVALADAQGLAFTMRQVAERVGLAPMSLYTYVPGRPELVALMVDEVAGESPYAPHTGVLRDRMSALAHQVRDELQKHSWMLEAQVARPWIGPHLARRYEWQLAALEGEGFSDLEMNQTVTLLTGFAESAARAAIGVRESRSNSTVSDHEWWEINAPFLERVMSEDGYPLASRVGHAAGESYDSISNPALAFSFGLDRVLDGLEAFLHQSRLL